MNIIEFIDEIAPLHDQVSCDDTESENADLTHFDQPQCVRCSLRYFSKHGSWKHRPLYIHLMTKQKTL